MKSKKIRVWIIFRNTCLVLVSILLIWIGFHHAMKTYEGLKYGASGQLVEVNGKKMHVVTEGDGEHTIVLMSGLGTAAPALDFEPLMNELSQTHKVVVIEPFGYGWSDRTNKERTVENIVEETRSALTEANIDEPYILMPHSISGIYSMYYANEYPEEIQAIIGIDFTLPRVLEHFDEPAPTMPGFLRVVEPTGLARLASLIIPEDLLPIADEGVYSEENLKMTKILSTRNAYNKNVIAEANETNNNINKTKDMSFSSDIPMLVFTTEEMGREDGKSKLGFYQNELSNVSSSRIIPLEGHHYLHWSEYEEIGQFVNDFIESKVDEL